MSFCRHARSAETKGKRRKRHHKTNNLGRFSTQKRLSVSLSCSYLPVRLAKPRLVLLRWSGTTCFWRSGAPVGCRKGPPARSVSRPASTAAARGQAAETNRGNAHEHQGVSGRRGRFRGHRARAPARASPRLPAGFGHLRRIGRHAGRAGVPRFRRRDRPCLPSARRVRLRRLRRGLSGSAAHGVARPDARARRPRHKRDRPLGRLPAQGSCRL